jgi:hypothetical protein
MSPILWGILAIAVALAGFAAVTWLKRPKLPPLEPGTELPPTLLQRVARVGLALGILPALAAGWLVYRYGAQMIYDDDGLRTVFTLCLLAIIVVFLVVTARLKMLVGRPNGALDERDRAILSRAPAWQHGLMFVTLAAWSTSLIVRFRADGAVPMVYIYLIFWSCWAASLLALPLGILIGYRKR